MGEYKTDNRGRDTFRKFKWAINIISSLYKIFPIKMRFRLLARHRYMRGKLGLGIRYALLKSLAQYCGDNVSVYEGVFLLNPQNLRIGNNVSIQPMCYIECGNDAESPLVIGDDVSLAHGVTVMCTTHTYDSSDISIKDQPVKNEQVIIENNVWVGAKACILSGLTISSGSIIGAGAVVTKDMEANKIYGGVPAKIIKERVK